MEGDHSTMTKIHAPDQLHGHRPSGRGARVKAASRDSGGASAPALTRATRLDTLKIDNSILTRKTVARSSRWAKIGSVTVTEPDLITL
jgi:hypothetical protein